jgi:hypothetical protein
MLQLFCGCKSILTAEYPMRSENNIAGTLEDFIHHYGATNTLFSDNSKAQTGCAVQQILRMYAIKDFQCEPHHQHQNYAERHIQEVKKLTNALLDHTSSPPSLWLLCVQHVVNILNSPLKACSGKPHLKQILVNNRISPPSFPSAGMNPFTTSLILHPCISHLSHRNVLDALLALLNTRVMPSLSLVLILPPLRWWPVPNSALDSKAMEIIDAFSHPMAGSLLLNQYCLQQTLLV